VSGQVGSFRLATPALFVVAGGWLSVTMACHPHGREDACLRAVSDSAAIAAHMIPDSNAAVQLALRGARCARYNPDLLVVGAFVRDSSSVVIRLEPSGTRAGGGPVLRVGRRGKLTVLERWQ